MYFLKMVVETIESNRSNGKGGRMVRLYEQDGLIIIPEQSNRPYLVFKWAVFGCKIKLNSASNHVQYNA